MRCRKCCLSFHASSGRMTMHPARFDPLIARVERHQRVEGFADGQAEQVDRWLGIAGGRELVAAGTRQRFGAGRDASQLRDAHGGVRNGARPERAPELDVLGQDPVGGRDRSLMCPGGGPNASIIDATAAALRSMAKSIAERPAAGWPARPGDSGRLADVRQSAEAGLVARLELGPGVTNGTSRRGVRGRRSRPRCRCARTSDRGRPPPVPS